MMNARGLAYHPTEESDCDANIRELSEQIGHVKQYLQGDRTGIILDARRYARELGQLEEMKRRCEAANEKQPSAYFRLCIQRMNHILTWLDQVLNS
jgi:hypothetical protein